MQYYVNLKHFTEAGEIKTDVRVEQELIQKQPLEIIGVIQVRNYVAWPGVMIPEKDRSERIGRDTQVVDSRGVTSEEARGWG